MRKRKKPFTQWQKNKLTVLLKMLFDKYHDLALKDATEFMEREGMNL